MITKLENPFIKRWKLDDEQWLKERKTSWKDDVKPLLLSNDDYDGAQMARYRDFYVFGKGEAYDVGWVFFTPSNTMEEVNEIIEFFDQEKEVARKHHNRVRRSTLMILCNHVYDGDDFLWIHETLGPHRRLVAKTIYHVEQPHFNMEDILDDKDINNKDDKFCTIYTINNVIRFIKSFERHSYEHLMITTHADPYDVSDLLIDYWIECVRYIEKMGLLDRLDERKYLRSLLMRCINYIEPDDSEYLKISRARFVKTMHERFEKEDIPTALRQEWGSLLPDGIIEEARVNNKWPGSLGAKVTFGGNGLQDAAVIFNACQKFQFINESQQDYVSKVVDISGIVTTGFKKLLPGSLNSIPAWHWVIELNHIFCGSLQTNARYSMHLFIPIYESNTVEDKSVSLIVVYQLGEHYCNWISTEDITLNERKLSNALFSSIGKKMLVPNNRDENWEGNLSNALCYIDSPYFNANYDITNELIEFPNLDDFDDSEEEEEAIKQYHKLFETPEVLAFYSSPPPFTPWPDGTYQDIDMKQIINDSKGK